MRKLLRLTKVLVTAVLLGVGTSNVWADRVCFYDFATTTGLTITGSGEWVTDGNSRFGQVYHNDPNLKKEQRTNYLKLPTDVLSHSSTSNAMTIAFWVKATGAADFWFSPIFTAYASEGGNAVAKRFALETRGNLYFDYDGETTEYCNFTAAQNDAGSNYEGTYWLDDSQWHLYTITMTATAVKVYIDGVVLNSWTLDDETAGQKISKLFSNGSELTYICLGGNQYSTWADIDPAFYFDDFAVYDEALSANDIKAIITSKVGYATATLSGLTGSGKTIYPTYTLSAVDENGDPVASPTFIVADPYNLGSGDASIDGTTLTFTGASTKGLQITETSTNASVFVTCVGPYERTINQSFVYTSSSSVPTGVKNINYNQTPNGFTDTDLTVFQTTFSPGGGDASYAQYFKSLGFDAGKTAGTGTTLKMKFIKDYGLQTADQIFYLRLLSPLSGQILKISSYKGAATPTTKLSETALSYDYEFVTTPGGSYNTHTSEFGIGNVVVINSYEVYTPVTYTTIPETIPTSKIGNQSSNADLSSIILTHENVSSAATKIAAGSYASIYLRPQTGSDLTIEDVQSLIPAANKNSWWINMPQNNYNNRPLTYWRYQKGINVRAYAGSGAWNIYGYALTDGLNYTGGAITPSQNCSYDRSFTANIVNTICLPFAIDNTGGELGTFYTLDDTQTSGSTVAFKTVTTTEANKPYLFVPSATGTLTLAASTAFSAAGAETTTVGDFSLVGVQSATSINSDEDNSIYAFKTDGSLIKITTATTLKGMRAYLKATGASKSRLLRISLDGDESTAINVVNSEEPKEDVYYNLQGIRVSQPQKGLYIVNGKKVYVK